MYVKFEIGQNFPPVLKIVTHTVHYKEIRPHKVVFLFLVLQVTYKRPDHQGFLFFPLETKVERKWCTNSKMHCGE